MDDGDGPRAPVLVEVRLPGLRLLAAGARAAPVLVQLPGGRLPALRRPGRDQFFDPARVVAFPDLSLAGGAVRGWDRRNAYYFSMLIVAGAALRLRRRHAVGGAAGDARSEVVLYGSGEEKIAFSYLSEKGRSAVQSTRSRASCPTSSAATAKPNRSAVREELAKFISDARLPRVRRHAPDASARHVFVAGRNIHELSALPLDAGAAVLRARSSCRAGAARSPRRSSRRSPTACTSWSTSASTT